MTKENQTIEALLASARARVVAAFEADFGSVNPSGQRSAILETARRELQAAIAKIDDAIDVLRNAP